MPHRFERVPKDAQPHITLTDDIHEAPVRLWVDYSLHGDSDLCVVFEDGQAFRTWLDEVIGEAKRQNLTNRAVR
jgi:hypothetical protein